MPIMEAISQALNRDALEQFVLNPCVQSRHCDASLFLNGTADLRRSARSGITNEVRGLVAIGADTTRTDAQGRTSLMIARHHKHTEAAHYIAWEHDELVRVLAKCLGRTPTQMEIYGAATLDKLRQFRLRVREYVTPRIHRLLTAARAGDVESVDAMLESGEIGINVIDWTTEETAWSAALGCGHVPLCVDLLERGARVDGACWIRGRRYDLLAAAVLTGDVGFVRRVVSQGASLISPPDDNDITPTCALAEAVRIGSIEMIETLLELGVQFDRVRNGLQLPASFAHLLRRIEPTVPTDTSMEAELWLLLCAACWFQDHFLFGYLMTKYSVLQDLRPSPNNATRLLFLAVYRQNDEMVQELLRRGAPTTYGYSFSPVVAAIHADSLRMLEFLLARGANVNMTCFNTMKNPFCYSLLASAVYWGSTDCARRLVALETRQEYREAAFVTAATVGNLEIVTLMVESMLDLSIHDLQVSIMATQCPLILDLLLSRCCGNRFPISFFNLIFAMACRGGKSIDLLGVFVAHGIDVTVGTSDGRNRTSSLMNSVLGDGSDDVNPATLEFVLANGMPSLTTDRTGVTPEAKMEARCSQAHWLSKDTIDSYVACKELLAAYSTTPPRIAQARTAKRHKPNIF